MFLIIATWFTLAGLLTGLGAGVQRVCTGAPPSRPFSAFWIGWATWLGLLQLVHVRFALGSPWVLLLLIALGAPGLLWNRKTLAAAIRKLVHQHRLLVAGLAILGLWLCNRSLGPLLSIDAGLYHLTSIRWATEAPLVSGLGNLHGRLAFNSASFLWLSSLDQWPSTLRGFNITPGLLLLVAIIQIALEAVPGRNSAASAQGGTTFHTVLLLPLLYAATVMHVSSTSPDWTVLILGIVLASELARLSSRKPGDDPSACCLTIAALCSAGITVKLSFAALGATALAITAFDVLRSRAASHTSPARALGPGVVLALLLLVPWSMRGIELSGYPAYPSTLGAADVSWKVPQERVTAEVRWIRSWARAPGKEPDDVLGNADWIGPWLANRLRGSDSVALLVFPSALVALGLAATAIGRGGILRFATATLAPYAIAILAWFLSAPDPRFLGGSVWVCAAGLLASNARPQTTHDSRELVRRVFAAASVFCAVGFLAFTTYMGSAVGGAIIAPGPSNGRYPLRKVETQPFRTRSGLVLHVPRKGDQCWEALLPCTPYPAPRLRLRAADDPWGGFELIQ